MARPLLLVAMLAFPAVGRAAPPESVSLGTGGAVVSLATGTLYVMDPKDGVVAVDLATNRTKWSAQGLAAKPFAEVDGAVVAADESGALRLLEAGTGQAYAPCPTLPGPGVRLQDGLGSRQQSWGNARAGRAWVTSSNQTHYAGGAAPTPEMEAAARSSSTGVVELDVRRCTSRPGHDPFSPRGERYTSPRGTTFEVTSGSLLLQRTRGATRLPPIDLRQGNPNRFMAMVTADRRHVIVGESAGNAYPSQIVDVESGAVVATVTLPLFPPAALLVGRRLVIGGGAVWMFDLDRGQVLWVRGLRSTSYNGPYPPSAPPGRP